MRRSPSSGGGFKYSQVEVGEEMRKPVVATPLVRFALDVPTPPCHFFEQRLTTTPFNTDGVNDCDSVAILDRNPG